MLGEGLVHARDEHISQSKIEPVYYYHIGIPRYIGNTLHKQ